MANPSTDTPANEPDLFANVGSAPSAPASPAAPAPEPDLFAGVGSASQERPAPQATQGAPTAPVQAPGSPQPPAAQSPPTAIPESSNGPWEPGTIDPAQLQNPASPLDTFGAVAAGAAKGLFAAKDFFASGAGLFGQATPPEAQRSDLRKAVDEYSANQSAKWGAGYTLTEGIGQVAVGLLGASTGLGAVGEVGAIGKTVASAVGTAASFEPHAQNFASLVQQVPGLNGPLTQFFASSPSDSDTVGYAKNALTSLGLDAAVVGTFMASATMLKALNGGDAAAISAANADLEAALRDHVASLQQARQETATASQAGDARQWPTAQSTSSSPSSTSPSSVSSPAPSGGASD